MTKNLGSHKVSRDFWVIAELLETLVVRGAPLSYLYDELLVLHLLIPEEYATLLAVLCLLWLTLFREEEW